MSDCRVIRPVAATATGFPRRYKPCGKRGHHDGCESRGGKSRASRYRIFVKSGAGLGVTIYPLP